MVNCCINREVSVQVAARRGHQNLCVNRQGATPLLPFKLLIQILFGQISTIAPKSMMRIKSGFFNFDFLSHLRRGAFQLYNVVKSIILLLETIMLSNITHGRGKNVKTEKSAVEVSLYVCSQWHNPL